MAGQTINDRLLAARHSLAGQGLAKSVCKATTEEMIGPKKKHLDCKCAPKKQYLLYTQRNISINDAITCSFSYTIWEWNGCFDFSILKMVHPSSPSSSPSSFLSLSRALTKRPKTLYIYIYAIIYM